MNVVQNYLTTFMKGTFDVYQIRIFMRIVEQSNHVLKGQRASRLLGKAYTADGINCNFIIPIREFPGGEHHYSEYRHAAEELFSDKHVIEFVDENKTWHKCHIIENLSQNDGDGMLHFTVSLWLMRYIVNFVYGNFTMYNLQSAMMLPSAYAVRLYWLICNMDHPLSYTIPVLRAMLGVPEDKYTNTKDFIKRCILPPQKMFDDRHLNSFTFTRVKKGRFIQYLTFTPITRQEPTTGELTAMAALGAWCDPVLRQYLQSQCGFEYKELAANKPTLFEFSKVQQWQDKIIKIVDRARRKRAGKGYIISAMKAEIAAMKTL